MFPNKAGEASNEFEFTKLWLIDDTEGGSNIYDDDSDAIYIIYRYYNLVDNKLYETILSFCAAREMGIHFLNL